MGICQAGAGEPSMSLVVVGLSHKTAPVELREQLAIPADRLGQSLDALKNLGELKETVVLSTCNRLEIYACPISDRQKTKLSIHSFIKDLYQKPAVSQCLYERDGIEAIEHLFRVTAGLDSLVIGETEILGQVKSSYQLAQNHGTTAKIMNVLFQRALFAGKTVRNKTGLSEGASSVGSVAVQLAERIFGDLHNHKILLLGAGEIAEVTARHLKSQKAGDLVILNRTLSKAEELAKMLNGRAGPLERMAEEMITADIVVCSTSADRPLVTPSVVEAMMKERRGRSLYFIDIAVPRNVDPAVHDLDNVYVYNIDDLNSIVQENMEGRRKDVGLAEMLLKQMADEFLEWLKATQAGQAKALRHQI